MIRPSLSDLAQGVLDHVERTNLEKTNELSYTSKVAALDGPAGEMLKLAQILRVEANTEVTVTNEDLADFRERHGI